MSVMKNNTNTNDDLLRGFTFQELIDAVNSNESEINSETVTKVFNEILKEQIEDAKAELKEHMADIIKLSDNVY